MMDAMGKIVLRDRRQAEPPRDEIGRLALIVGAPGDEFDFGDSIGRKLTPGWPQVYAYGLEEENLQKVKEPIVVDLDGDQIYYRRYEENGGWGSCSGVQWLNSSTRHRIIAHWLGVPEKEMSWQPVEYFAIVWTGKAAYQRQLGEIVEAEREKLHGTVESLRQRGFLREGEGASLSPRLLVKVQCEINPCPLD